MRFVIPTGIQSLHADSSSQDVRRHGETPAYQRQRLTKMRLTRSGGKRGCFNLTSDAVQAIDAIREREGLHSDTDAVIAALVAYASRT